MCPRHPGWTSIAQRSTPAGCPDGDNETDLETGAEVLLEAARGELASRSTMWRMGQHWERRGPLGLSMLSVGGGRRSVAPGSAQLGVPDTGTGEGTLDSRVRWKYAGFQLGKVLWAASRPRALAADAGRPSLHHCGLRGLGRTEDDWEVGAGALLTGSLDHAPPGAAVAMA